MPIYIALTVLSEEGRKAIKERPEQIKEHNKRLQAMGVKPLAQYATLGQYDFVNIFEAPNNDAIYKVAVHLSGGVAQTTTLVAKTLDEFLAAVKK
ncbi:MAG: GYD domain-containing protein [Nitrososphaerota archaeon]|nr:GYD domain-containing protein [Nitrososphaerota archaeon]